MPAFWEIARPGALFISDVPSDDPAVIGSGVLGPAVGHEDRIERTIVASLDHAVDGVCVAAEKLGLDVRRPVGRFDDDAARLAVRFTHELHLNSAQVCVWGGESTVQLPPNLVAADAISTSPWLRLDYLRDSRI